MYGPVGVDRLVAVASTNGKLNLSSITQFQTATAVFRQYNGSVPRFGNDLMGRIEASARNNVSFREWDSKTITYSVSY